MSWRVLLRRGAPVLALVAVAAVFGAVEPSFVSEANLKNVLVQTLTVALGAIGMTYVIVSGGIDLSVGSLVALASVVTALGLEADLAWPVALAGGVLVGAAAGLVNGILVVGVGIVPFVATLGMMGVARGLAKWLADETTVVPSPRQAEPVAALVEKSYFAPALLGTVGLAVLAALALRRTVFGTWVHALGSNEDTARLCGVPVRAAKVAIYAVGGAFAGLAGAVLFGRLSVGDPTAAMGMELDVIAAVVIGGASLSGGTGTIAGAMAGALLMATLDNGCNLVGVPNFVQEILVGALLVVAVALDRVRQRDA